jgi:hypothetical protein
VAFAATAIVYRCCDREERDATPHTERADGAPWFLHPSIGHVQHEHEPSGSKIGFLTVQLSKTILLAVIASSAVAAGANAANMNLTFTGIGPSKDLKINYNTNRQYNQNANGSWTTFKAGRMKWTKVGGGTVNSYCTQLAESISVGQTVNYTVAAIENVPDPNPGAMGAIRAQLVRDLYARHYGAVKNSADSKLNAAFQLTIWEITHENLTAANAQAALAQLNVGTGALAVNLNNSTTAQVAAIAMQMIASLGQNGFGSFGNVLGLTDPNVQDQLIVVPLPMTLGLAAAGLAGVIGLRRRFR